MKKAARHSAELNFYTINERTFKKGKYYHGFNHKA